jgi:hypothetical protein
MVLLDCVWRCYEDGEFFEVVDTRLMNNFDGKTNEHKFSPWNLAFISKSNARPTMGYVCQMFISHYSLPPLALHKPMASYFSQNLVQSSWICSTNQVIIREHFTTHSR